MSFIVDQTCFADLLHTAHTFCSVLPGATSHAGPTSALSFLLMIKTRPVHLAAWKLVPF